MHMANYHDNIISGGVNIPANIQKNYKCADCDEDIKADNDLELHINEHHKENKYAIYAYTHGPVTGQIDSQWPVPGGV